MTGYNQNQQTTSHQSDQGYALDWDQEVEVPDDLEEQFVVLENGDYPFEVICMEKGRMDCKLGNVAAARVKVKIFGNVGAALRVENFLLHSRLLWKICQFFTALGLRKQGEKSFTPNWNSIIGRRGMCRVLKKTVASTKTPGTQVEVNEIERYLPPSEPQTPPVQPEKPTAGFTPNQF